MDISVIIPVYNVGKFIDCALLSMFSQTKTENVEYIVVNDCSTDDSRLKIEKLVVQYAHLNIKLINNEKKLGVAAVRQIGLMNSTGDYITHFDSDDWVEPDMLEDMYNEIKRSGADIVVCDYYVNYEKKELYIKQPANSNSLDCVKMLLKGELHGSLCNKLVSRKLYEEHQLNFLDGVNYMEDFTVCIKLFYYANCVAYLPKAFLHYVQFNTSSYTKLFSVEKALNVEESIHHILSFLDENQLGLLCKNEIISYKLNMKKELVINTRGALQRKYSLFYPEANNLIFTNSVLPLHYKCALWFISYKMRFIGNMIFNIVNFLKNVRN